jgi:hypothetical protein
MRKANLKIAGILVTLLLVAGFGWYSSGGCLQATAPAPKDAKLKELLKERLGTLRDVVALTSTQVQQGVGDFGLLREAMQALMRAELELCDSDKERITVLEKLFALAMESEKGVEGRFKAGGVGKREVLMAKANRLDFEIALERLKAKAQDRPK